MERRICKKITKQYFCNWSFSRQYSDRCARNASKYTRILVSSDEWPQVTANQALFVYLTRSVSFQVITSAIGIDRERARITLLKTLKGVKIRSFSDAVHAVKTRSAAD